MNVLYGLVIGLGALLAAGFLWLIIDIWQAKRWLDDWEKRDTRCRCESCRRQRGEPAA